MPDTDSAPTARLNFERPPGALPTFLKALFDRRPGRLEAGATAGRIEARIETLGWPGTRLRRYREVCGYPDGQTLPLCFPHVIAAGLHARMLMRPEFPVRLPGLIHVWHEIRQERPLRVDEQLAMECSIEGHRETDSGAEFRLRTVVIADRTRIWEEDTGFISRSARRGPKGPSRAPEAPADMSRVVDEWKAEAGIGRRYARASGDFNPIHLFDAAARRFGFPAAIAHGMWTLSRSVAALEKMSARQTSAARVRFRRPVFIPSSLQLAAGGDTAEGIPFEVRKSDAGGIVLDGVWEG